MIPEPVFAVSTGRTGSQFLAHALRKLGADAHHEPGPFWVRHVSNAFVSGSISQERVHQIVSRARPSLGTGYVESSCLIYGLVSPILTVFPGAKVFHVVRDPRTYTRSALNWGVHRIEGRPLNLAPFRRLAPAQFEPLSLRARLDWALAGQLERVCWSWVAMNRAMRQQGGDSDRYRLIRFEDLFGNPGDPTAFSLLAQAAKVEATEAEMKAALDERVNEARRDVFPAFDLWPERMRRLVTDMCGAEATVYGYDLGSDQ